MEWEVTLAALLRTKALRSRLLPVVAAVAAVVGGGVIVLDDTRPQHSDDSSNGPLGGGGDSGTVCFGRLAGKQRVTIGVEVFANRGPNQVTVDSLALEGAKGLHLSGAVLVPIAGHTAVGVLYNYPPLANELAAGVLWNARQDVVGAVLPPNSDVHGTTGVFSLAVGLEKSGAEDGTLEQFVMKYHTDSGRHYTLQTHDGVKLIAAACEPPSTPP